MTSFRDLPKEEHKKVSSKGGINSAKARRDRKKMKETAELIMSLPLRGGQKQQIEMIQSFGALNGKNISVSEAIVFAQAKRAIKGDKQAAEFIRDTAGQKPGEKLDVQGAVPVILSGDDEIKD